MNIESIQNSLANQGYARTQYYPGVQFAVNDAISAWKDFCDQPVNHKGLIPFEDNGGYENKDKLQNPELMDHKEDFHVTRRYHFDSTFKQTARDAHFMYAASMLFAAINQVLVDVSIALSTITNVDFKNLATSIQDGWTLRFLHYYPQDSQVLAHQHVDKGGHTLHLYDSTPGFERYWDGKWQSMSFPHDSMVFFPGMLGQYYSHSQLKALAHRVVSSPESKKFGRYSIVLFNDYAKADMVYDKEKYGSTQKLFPPGQNYGMDFEHFKHYFKNRTSKDAR
jgi:isopenicillin N synthase-like dioxygenase